MTAHGNGGGLASGYWEKVDGSDGAGKGREKSWINNLDF